MSLVGWWKLDGDATDSIGSFDGYEQGSPSYSNGKIRDCYDNTGGGSNGIELIRDEDFTEFEDYYSFSLWFKSTTTSGDGGARIIVRDASEYPSVILRQDESSPQSIRFYEATETDTTSVSVNEWHHMAFTVDNGQNESRLYIDGQLVGTGGVNDATTARPYVIGGNTEGDGDISGDHFIGKIDDVRLYDHKLSIKEIKQLSKAKVLHYKFDQEPRFIEASGGSTVVEKKINGSRYRIHAFENTGSNTFSVNNAPPDANVDVLVVAGGGSGGNGTGGGGGGGGAGGVAFGQNISVSAGSFSVEVGDGGGSSGDGRNAGSDSFFDSGGSNEIRAIGGGGGSLGGSGSSETGQDGGSGGGGADSRSAEGSGIQPGTNSNAQDFGNDGGPETSTNNTGSGGGGATEAGQSIENTNGDGGDGVDFSNTFGTSFGENGVFGGGGGGGGSGQNGDNEDGKGGLGGGGRGAGGGRSDPEDGTDGTGGGGGGADNTFGTGGSGVVLVRYKLPEVKDDSGSGNDGVLYQPTYTKSSKIGSGAYSFNGSGDMIPTELYYNTTDLNAVTVSVWYKSSSSADQIIAASDRSEYWRLGVGSDGEDGVQWTVDSSDLISSASRSELQDGNWHHIVGVFDTSLSNDHKIYIDGELDSEASYYSSGIGSGAVSYTHIGVGSEASSFDGDTGPDDWMNGLLDDVRIYHRGLSASEVRQLYEQRASIDSGGNMFSHEFEESPNRKGAETPIFTVSSNSVAALENDTKVLVNGSLETTLSAQETASLSNSEGDIVSSDKPLYHGGSLPGVPLGWGGKTFAWRNDRYTPIDAYIYAVRGDAEVDIYRSDAPGTVDTSYSISQGNYVKHGTTTTYQYIIESDELVSVFVRADGDYRPIYPVNKEIYGIPSSDNQITAVEDNTTINVVRSDGTTANNTINRGESWSSGGTGSQFSGASDYIYADKPVAAGSQADSDGGEMTPYTSVDAFATHFVLPTRAEFVSFVGKKLDAEVSIYDSSGNLLDTKTVSGGSGDRPTKLRIHEDDESYSLNAGVKFVCSDPQWAMFENRSNEDETIFFGAYSGQYQEGYTTEELSMGPKGVTDVPEINEIGPAAESLVGYWPLDGDARDYSGNGNHGAVNGASVTSGLGQSAYEFDKSANGGDGATVTSSSLDGSPNNQITAAAWLYPYGSSDSRGTIIRPDQFYFQHHSNDRIATFWYGWNDRGYHYSSPNTVPTNQWTHAVVTWSSNGEIDFYFNGEHDKTITGVGSGGGNNLDAVTGIGRQGAGNRRYNGKIQDLRIYDRALTAEEVKILYNLTNPRQDQKIIQASSGEVFTKGEFSETL